MRPAEAGEQQARVPQENKLPRLEKNPQHRTAEEALSQPVTLSYQRVTLEHAMQRLSAQIGIPITIINGDLMRAGISKNQSLQLEVFNLQADACLGHILMLVDRTEQLTFITRVRPDGREEIAITTNAAIANP